MRSTFIALMALGLTIPSIGVAQSGAAGGSPQDATQPAPKKKGGLFGKLKSVAKNKVVQQVAKTAACNMVPGGQLLVGAVDKKLSQGAAKDAAKTAAKDAAKGAAMGAASGLAGAKNPCMPGLMSGGNPSSALAGGIPGAGLPGLPNVAAPRVGVSADQIKMMQEQYAKMGMNPAQIQAMTQQMTAAQTAGTPAVGMSADQMQQLLEQYRKMGMDPAQLQAMQEMMANSSGAAKGAVTLPPPPTSTAKAKPAKPHK
jgi:hypothetical protein